MHRATGMSIGLLEHIAQSVADIITTPLYSRVMRREYGSLLPYLIDQPDNGATTLRLYAAVAAALMRWEPRIRIARLQIARDPERPGYAELRLTGSYVGQPLRRPLPLDLTVPFSLAIA
jgi:phage baseplate assembly protein W